MKRFANIALIVEPDADNKAALNRAASLAARNRAKLTVVAVAPELGPIANDALREALANVTREELRHLVSQAPNYLPDIHTQLIAGATPIDVIRAVVVHGYDLVIKATEPTASAAETLGPFDKKLLRKCPCPVWLVRDAGPARYERILVAIDYRPENTGNDALNRQLLEMAASLASMEGARLHVTHAWRLQGEDTLRSSRTGLPAVKVDELVRAERAVHQIWLAAVVAKDCPSLDGAHEPERHLIEGAARAVVPQLATTIDAQLVVMGTVGRTGIPGYFIGNTAEAILGRIDCAIMAVKPPGFLSPVVS
ncbi:MAG: universal stress protein [Pseudomonadota bacterium]